MATGSSTNRINVTITPKKTVMVNQSGAIAVRRLSDLIDVDTTSKNDGSLLIYDEEQEKFIASTLLEKQTVNGGHF
jgi:hypothetical protein